MNASALQRETAWAEDRATQRCDPSAVPGAKTEERAVVLNESAVRLALRDWHQSVKPSRQDAATITHDAHSQLANADRKKFQFTLNQDSIS